MELQQILLAAEIKGKREASLGSFYLKRQDDSGWEPTVSASKTGGALSPILVPACGGSESFLDEVYDAQKRPKSLFHRIGTGSFVPADFRQILHSYKVFCSFVMMAMTRRQLLNPSSSQLSSIPETPEKQAGTQSRRSKASWRRLLPAACVFILICAFQWPILSGLYSFLDVGPDIVNMAVPDLDLRAHALRSHRIPIWDPYENGGQAMLGELTAGLLDPFSYLLLSMPLRHGHIPYGHIQVYFAFLHGMAGIAAYLLARELKVRTSAAIIAGVFYAIAGVPGDSIWIQFVTEAIYPPLVLLFLIRSLRGKRALGNSALAGVLLGISWFSGTHHIPLVASLCCGTLLLVFIFLDHWRRGLARVLVFATMMLLISAPQIVPALQYGRFSTRWVGLDEPVIGAAKVPFQAHLRPENVRPSQLLGIVFPVDFGFWGAGIVFAGIVAVVLAFYGARRLSSSRLVRLCLALVVAGILMTLSQHNIFYGLFYWLVPGFDKLRESTLWIYAAHLGFTCLVALGADFFLSQHEPRGDQQVARVLFAIGGVLLTVGYILRFWMIPQHEAEVDRLAMSGLIALLLSLLVFVFHRHLIKPWIASALLIGLLMIEHGNVSSLGGRIYFPRGHGFTSRYEQPLRATEPIAQFLRTRPDLERMDVNRSDVPMNFGDYHRIEEMSSHGASMLTSLYELRFWEPRIQQLYGVNYYIARAPSRPDQVDIYTSPSGIKVFKNPNPRPRVWTVHNVLRVAGYDQARKLLSSPSFDMSTTSFVDGPPPEVQNCNSNDRVELVSRDWFSVVIHATLACKGMIVLNDNWYPGWRSSIDGRATPIFPAFMAIRGVVADAGEHTIEMHYRPRSFYLGVLLFAVGIAGTVVLFSRTEDPGIDLLA